MLDESFAARQPAGSSSSRVLLCMKGPCRHRRRPENRKAAWRCANSAGPARSRSQVADEVELVFSTASRMRSARPVLSRPTRPPRGSWASREGVHNNEKVHGVIFQSGQGRLHCRSRRRGGLPAALAGRYPTDPRRRAADEQFAAVPDPQDGSPPRQHRGVAPHGSRRDSRRTAPGTWCKTSKRVRSSTAWSKHHRLRCVRRSRRHRRPVALHGLAIVSTPSG